MKLRHLWAPLVLLAGLACRTSTPVQAVDASAVAPVEARSVEPREWAHESSDIPVDPRIHFGHLDNGLRWAWARNGEPQERSYLRLHVDVGSLAETEAERGMAHFLEHMAFNGSENFEPGTLIEWFQEHGMSFGADTNAMTGFSETIYQLDLPSSDEETLREGLLVLRDFASRLDLAAEEVEAEKGVIDGEQRERDSAGFRILEKTLDLAFEGTRLPRRLPIGTKEARDAFDAESVRAFYERWYRPQNMTLVLVGDLGELDPEPLFSAFFADMDPGTAPLAAEPDLGEVEDLGRVYSIYEDEVPSVRLTAERLLPYEEDPVTIEEWVADLPLDYARSMLNLRFDELVKEADAPFLGAGVGEGGGFELTEGEALSVTATPETWRAALVASAVELRRALEFGFQQAELDEVRANALRSLKEAEEREATANSRGLLSRLLLAAEDPYVPTDAATRRRVLAPAIEALTVEACHAALREAWGEGELSLSATGNLDLGDAVEASLLGAWEEAWAAELEAGEEIVVADFAYASEPDQAGEIASRRHVDDLDFEEVRFANGVMCNVKRTDFKEKQVLVSVRFGEGELSLAPEDSVLQWVGERIFSAGGLEEHSQDELRRILAGKNVRAGFSVGTDAFALSGTTSSEDLLLECELLCAYLEAPGWREEGLVELRRQVPLFFESMEHQHGGPVAMEFMPALFSNHPRYAAPDEERILATEIEPVRAWLDPELAAAPIEVSFVGDLDVEETIALAARTFGTLPERREPRRYEERRDVPAPLAGLRQVHTIDTEIPKSLVVIAVPLTDGIDVDRLRVMNVLGTVVNDRLRVEVRERLGAAYSPGARVQASRTYPGVGLLMIEAMSDPEKVDALVEACLAVVDDLAEHGIPDEEIDRLREPILKSRRDAKRRNGYWMSVLSEAQGRPEHLDEIRTADAFYETYTAEDIEPIAAEFLDRERASVLVVHPEGAVQ